MNESFDADAIALQLWHRKEASKYGREADRIEETQTLEQRWLFSRYGSQRDGGDARDHRVKVEIVKSRC